MKKIIYLVAVVIVSVVFALYTPKMIASANDKLEQRAINKQIMDLQLQLEDVQSQWEVFDDQKQELEEQIKEIESWIKSITEEQYTLHRQAELIRNSIKQLKWEKTLNETVENCYQYEWELYNECLDAITYVQANSGL